MSKLEGASGVEGSGRLQGAGSLRQPPKEIKREGEEFGVQQKVYLPPPVQQKPRPHGKPFAFALAHGEGGASIWWGVLITSVTTASFTRFTVGSTKINGLTEQQAIQNISVHEAPSLETDKLRQTHLGWYGDVYAQWNCDDAGNVTGFDIVGPSEPDGIEISVLNEELEREDTEGLYYIKIGTVDEGSPVDQIVSSDIYWAVTIFRGDVNSSEGSQPESSGSSGSSAPSSVGSSKDTAIVPASWARHGFTALAALETPDVRFNDVFQDLKVRGRESSYRIDPRFLEVIEADTLRVIGWSADNEFGVGFKVKGGTLTIIAAKDKRRRPELVQVYFSAIRRGFRGWRFPDKTEAQFEANERRLNGT